MRRGRIHLALAAGIAAGFVAAGAKAEPVGAVLPREAVLHYAYSGPDDYYSGGVYVEEDRSWLVEDPCAAAVNACTVDAPWCLPASICGGTEQCELISPARYQDGRYFECEIVLDRSTGLL